MTASHSEKEEEENGHHHDSTASVSSRQQQQQEEENDNDDVETFLQSLSFQQDDNDNNNNDDDVLVLSDTSTSSEDDKDDDEAFPDFVLRDYPDNDLTTIKSLSRTKTSVSSSLSSLMDVAAAVTQESCQLLGTKSIGVDYGLVRTGVAQTVGYEPTPVTIIKDCTNTQVCETVVATARQEQATRIVVGLPLHKNGTIAEQTNVTLVFVYELTCRALETLGPNIPVLVWDERYTSKEAKARAHSINPNTQLYGQLDADAACIILEHYYRENGKGAQQLIVPEDVYKTCMRHYRQSQLDKQSQAQTILLERERKLQQRKESIQRAQLEREQANENHNNDSKKKKKKKKKRKR